MTCSEWPKNPGDDAPLRVKVEWLRDVARRRGDMPWMLRAGPREVRDGPSRAICDAFRTHDVQAGAEAYRAGALPSLRGGL